MATGNCWSLWQQLPPRYQLTTQELTTDDDGKVIVPMFGNPGTPLSTRSRTESPRDSPEKQTGTTLAGIPPHTTDNRLRALLDRKKFSFPCRNSRYITNMKVQQRVNSAKQKITEDPSIVTFAPTMKRKPTQVFPVTKLSTLQRYDVESKEYITDSRNSVYSTSSKSTSPSKVVPVQNIFPFDESRSPRKSELESKRYLVTDTDDAIMFSDKGKISYFKKSRYPLMQVAAKAIGPYSAKRDDGSYIAHLRKIYLKNYSFLSKTKPDTEMDMKYINEQRADYDKKVGHILDYYSVSDQKGKGDDEAGRSKTPTQRPRTGSARARIRTPSPRGPRLRSLLSSPVPPSAPAQTAPRVLGSLEELGYYVKLNQRSVLHEKQFYLRTPGIRVLIPGVQNINPNEIASCGCRLCRVEMELSVLAQMNAMGIGLPSDVTSHILNRQPEAVETECPGRPNSAVRDTPKDEPIIEPSSAPDEPRVLKQEPITVKLPEISEEREPSDVTSLPSARMADSALPDSSKCPETVSVACQKDREVSIESESTPKAQEAKRKEETNQ